MAEKVHIAIDGNEANVTNRVGSNVYAYQLLQALERLTHQKDNITCTVLLSQQPKDDMPTPREGWRYQVVLPERLWTQWAAPRHLLSHLNDYDVFFTPGHYAPRLCSIPYVSTVMDMSYITHPEYFKKKDFQQLYHWTKYSARRAEKVVAISRATKQDVLQHYKRKPEDVVVAYPGVSDLPTVSTAEKKKVLRRYKITKPFLAYVGTLQPRKNITRMIEAYEQVRRHMEQGIFSPRSKRVASPQLVLIGKVGWLAEPILERIVSSPYTDDIILTGFVSNSDKTALLSQAELLVLLGLYEGFGIPPLEALQLGVVPVVSNTTSLPEVVGEAGIKVDPNSTPDCIRGIKEGLNLKAKERAVYRRKAREQIQKFDWDTSAQKVLDTLLEIAQ